MPQLVHESVALTEATTGTTDATGVLEVEFITPGWGSSGYYGRAVVEAAAPLFAVGTHMYFDHPTDEELTARPVRSVRDLAAVIIEAGHVDPTTGGIRGKVKPLKPYRELLTDENFTANVGVSIRGSASDIVVGEAEGRTGPIIEGLVDLASVDFVTRAGRGGSILGVLESARQADVHEATASDRHQQLQRAVRAAYDGPSRWVYVRDHDADQRVVWFDISTDGPTETWQQTYDVGTNDVDITLTGEPTRVSALTTYVPVNPAGQTTTQESEEDTMPQIEEARLRQLEEASGRVTALEERATTAETERDQARRERDELRARESATTHARSRVTAANAALPTSTVDRIVAEATRAVPLTEAGQLDTAALDTRVDAARTTEETYLAGLAEAAGIGSVSGFGGTAAGAQTTTLTEADLDAAVGSAFGHQIGA